MAESRKPSYRIAITGPEGRRVAELYPASLFPGGEQSPSLYRVRVDRVWITHEGMKYLFLPLGDALAIAGWSHEEASPPKLERGDRRRMLLGQDADGADVYESVVAMTDPWQGRDGRWRVFLVGHRDPVLTGILT